jgi:hypothetical protein
MGNSAPQKNLPGKGWMLCQGKTVMHIFEQLPYRPIGYAGQKRDNFRSQCDAVVHL